MSTDNTQTLDRSDLYCPHFKDVDEKTLRKLFSKVAAVRADNRELFEFTHRPIQVFRSPQGSQETQEVVGEKQVYQEFSEDIDGNFAVVIEGEVGTGKSELCAYLAHQLEDDGRPILHVDKNDDLMTLLSERIPEFYEEQFGEELPGASNFQQLRNNLQQHGQVVANNATSGAILNLDARGYEVDADDKEEQIREFVEDQLSLLIEKGEYAKEIKFVTEQEYRQNEYLQIFEGDESIEEVVTAFNEELWREIRERYKTQSLDNVLERVGEKFEDTRPVIIFEDFAITAMEGKKLRNYMERDKSVDNWDFIVAGTRDSTSILHTQTAEDRFQFYRTNKQNSNSVLFLDEDSAVDFIRPYLGYFKSQDGSVRYDRSGEGLSLSLKEAPAGSVCAECGFCSESFRDLFPFNRPFLRRIYAGLGEDEQSPREYVMAVFDVLRDYYEGYIDAPSDADRLDPLLKSIDPATEIAEESESIFDLACWYGIESNDGIRVDRRFVEAFGLTDAVAENEHLSFDGDQLVVPTEVDVEPPEEEEEDEEEGEEGGDDGGTDGETPPVEKIRADEKIEELRPNVRAWQSNPANFEEITRLLQTGLTDALNRLTNDYELYDGMGLRYSLSSQKNPFVFAKHNEAPEADQIIIDPDEFTLADLRNLFEFGVYREMHKPSADYEDLFDDLGTQLTGYARGWRQTIIDENLRSSDRFFVKGADYTFEDFALAGYAYVVMLDSPYQELSAEALDERFSKNDTYALDSDLDSELRDEVGEDHYINISDFMDYAPQFEKLVNAFFGATQNTLDVGEIRKRLRKNPPIVVLSKLGRQYIGDISPRVRFDTNNKIRDMGHSAYDVESALSELSDEYRESVVETFETELAAADLDQIEGLLDTLRTYDDADAEMIESLGQFVTLRQDDFDDAIEAAQLADSLHTESHDGPIQATLISMKMEATNVYQRYRNLTIVGGGDTQEFAARFRQVGDHYVE